MRKIANPKTSFQKDFYSDLEPADMLYAVTVRAPVERGIIREILPPPLPKGYILITADDIPGGKTVDILGQRLPVFCSGRIAYKGEPLALLVGGDEATLRDLIFGFNVVIDEDPEAESSEGKTLCVREVRYGSFFTAGKAVSDNDKSNDAEEHNEGNLDINGMFELCEHVYEHEWIYDIESEYYGETNGAVAFWNEGTLTILTPTQWTGNLRKALSRVLDTAAESILIKRTVAQNRTTSSIWYNSVIACQAAVASLITAQPVRLSYSREEQDVMLNAHRPIRLQYKTGANDRGELEALEAHIALECGFADPFAKEITERLAIAAAGVYHVKNLYVRVEAKTTRLPAAAISIKRLDSAAFFALENQIEAMCRVCNLTPIEMRKINYLENAPGSRRPRDTVFVFEIEKYNNVLDALVKSSDFERKYAAYGLDASYMEERMHPKQYVSAFSTPLRGIGCACAFEGSSYYGTKPYRTQTMGVTLEGKTGANLGLTIHAPPVSVHVLDVWTKAAADILGVKASDLKVKMDTSFKISETIPYPEAFYDNIGIMTSLLTRCCASLKNKIQGASSPVTIRKRSSPVSEWDGAAFTGRPFYSTSFAAATVEVEVNPFNYRGNIRSIDIVINGGKIMNPQVAASSIRLAVQRSLSSLLENDDLECGNIRISFVQSDRKPSAIGELVYKVIPAAYTQALSQALDCTIDKLPLKADSLYTAIRLKAMAKEQTSSQIKTDKEAAQELSAATVENDKTESLDKDGSP